MDFPRAARLTVILAALFALFFPTSTGGVISLVLERAGILLNIAIFAALLAAGCRGSRLQALAGFGLIAWLSLLTLGSPQAPLAPGIIAIFVGLALMLATDVRGVTAPQVTRRMLGGINVFAFVLGTALALDIQWADGLVKTHYAAFYPQLLVSMLDWHNKPVLTFATHALAGFFYYLFFYLNLRTYVATGSRAALAAALGHIALGLALRSTTGYILMALAAAQLSVACWRRYQRWIAWVPLVAPLVIAAVVVVEMERVAALGGPIRDIIVGTEASGLLARYSATGMLGGNLRYLRDSPFSPLGFTYGLDRDLFYGDSGLIQLMLRGSLPLVFLTYGGLYLFLRRNLRSLTDARWLFLVTLAFEVGYVPLFRYRFTAFLPFMIVYLNDLADRTRRAQPEPLRTRNLTCGVKFRGSQVSVGGRGPEAAAR